MTQQEALDWANGGWQSSPYAKTETAGFGIDVDGSFGFQCVDFVTAYADFLGTPVNGGQVLNAITLWNDQPEWSKVTTPQPGDVFVRDAVFNGVNYGDTGIVVEVKSSGVQVVQQNLKADLYHGSPPDSMFWSFGQLKGYIRSNNIGSFMNQDQAIDLARTLRLLAGESVDEANSHVEDDANHIVADSLYATALAKQLYNGEWQNLANDATKYRQGVLNAIPLESGKLYKVN